jgi:hypothetical protein
MSSDVKTTTELLLPPSVISRVDVSRLVSELERIDNDVTAAAVRAKVGAGQQTDTLVSDQLTDFLSANKLSLASDQERGDALATLRQLKDEAPIVHLTFAVPADRESLQQLVQWLRSSVHPQAVIAVGLQPSLIAGVYVRTANQVHDLSLRGMLAGGHDVLVKELETIRGSK